MVLRLEAVDAIGQRGQSAPLQIVLPAREFRNPLARAIIEERRKLVGEPGQGRRGGATAGGAGRNQGRAGPADRPCRWALRIAAARLAMNQGDAASRRSVVDLLWELALFIEDGSLSLAERKLRDLQEQLQKALERGCQGCRARAADGGAAAGDGRVPGRADPPGAGAGPADAAAEQMQQPTRTARRSSRRDLQEMLDRARELMRAAPAMRPGRCWPSCRRCWRICGPARSRPQPSPGEQNLSDLQKMIQLQQQLLERSFQMDRDQRQGQQQQGQQGQQGQQRQGQQGQQQASRASSGQEPDGPVRGRAGGAAPGAGRADAADGRGRDGDPARAGSGRDADARRPRRAAAGRAGRGRRRADARRSTRCSAAARR